MVIPSWDFSTVKMSRAKVHPRGYPRAQELELEYRERSSFESLNRANRANVAARVEYGPRLLFLVRKPGRSAVAGRFEPRIEAGKFCRRQPFETRGSGLARRPFAIPRSRRSAEVIFRRPTKNFRFAAAAGRN